MWHSLTTQWVDSPSHVVEPSYKKNLSRLELKLQAESFKDSLHGPRGAQVAVSPGHVRVSQSPSYVTRPNLDQYFKLLRSSRGMDEWYFGIHGWAGDWWAKIFINGRCSCADGTAHPCGSYVGPTWAPTNHEKCGVERSGYDPLIHKIFKSSHHSPLDMQPSRSTVLEGDMFVRRSNPFGLSIKSIGFDDLQVGSTFYIFTLIFAPFPAGSHQDL